MFGGRINTPQTGVCETWDGSSWTETGDLGQARYAAGYAGESNSAGMISGGTYPPGNRVAISEQFNGTSWSEQADLNSNREHAGSGGRSTKNAFICSGSGPPGAANAGTEVWNAALEAQTVAFD